MNSTVLMYIAHTPSGPAMTLTTSPLTLPFFAFGVACNCEPFNCSQKHGRTNCGQCPSSLDCGLLASWCLALFQRLKSEQKYVPRLGFGRHRSFDIGAGSSPQPSTRDLSLGFSTGDPLVFVLKINHWRWR